MEFDCAHGTLDHPLRVDERGRFSVAGTFSARARRTRASGEVPESQTSPLSGTGWTARSWSSR